ncbi:acetyl-CoA carboxylase biotin carboxyl carrier protein [Fodinicola feengrottensis]|uniref:Biotin carboxyl carrier protein of acetyl-CoA carboxylase n=1 Tax=Fodinicola feengrottensis TaxID=435914 RepID=A0ABN2G5T9_9ACTN|nr:acetyl-CoA carboxylase biotin carboxyl carrier protein [Fodinicola feengrottensis]
MTDSPELLEELCRHAVQILDGTRGPVRSVRLRAGDITVEVERPEATSVQHAVAVVEQAPAAETTDPAESICAPTVGTFFRSPEPGADPFVREGDQVQEGQQVAILEAMKLMNPIEADRSGRVVRVLVPDGESVEYGQPLFVIAPAA